MPRSCMVKAAGVASHLHGLTKAELIERLQAWEQFPKPAPKPDPDVITGLENRHQADLKIIGGLHVETDVLHRQIQLLQDTIVQIAHNRG